jgi:hypothetical protein
MKEYFPNCIFGVELKLLMKFKKMHCNKYTGEKIGLHMGQHNTVIETEESFSRNNHITGISP